MTTNINEAFNKPTAWRPNDTHYLEKIEGIGDVVSIVEIGVDYGFSLFTFARDFPNARVIGVDNFSYGDGKEQQSHLQNFLPLFPKASIIAAESGEARRVYEHTDFYLDIDILHIDADHSYEGVKRDFDLWSNAVRPGGVVLFHDINSFPEGPGRFFKELEGKKDSITQGAGLGIWWKDVD